MSNPRVLLAAPVNMIKYYILFDWLDHLATLTYHAFDIFLVDNTGDKAFSQGLKNLGYDCYWVDPADRPAREYMAESNEVMRKKALIDKYDYLFILECDIITPRSVIEMLLIHKLPVVGAAYWTGHGEETRKQLRKLVEISPGNYLNKDYSIEETFAFMDGSCKPAFANGNGCIMIHRTVLEKIKFRIDPESIGFADNFFHNDLFAMGIPNYVDTSIGLVHYNMDWNIVYDNISELEKEKQLNK